jgi:Kef-type K+ transport system membrane component KefB
MNSKSNGVGNKRLIGIMLAVVAILLIPFTAMQFTSEVDWNVADFIIMGVLLTSTGVACELVLRTVKKTGHRIFLCGIVLIVLFLIWAELAVGIFGTPIAGS